jgi:exonuclease SbcC
MSIIKCIDAYFLKHKERNKFSQNTFNLKYTLVANDILKEDPNQLNLLSEILIFISSISSKKDIYLDRVAELDEMICNVFFVVIEKYIFIDTEAINQSRSIMLDKSVFGLNTSMISRYDREKNNLIQGLKEQEKQISNLKNQVENLLKEKKKLENIIKDKENEMEVIKLSNNNTELIQDQLVSSNIIQSELKNKLEEKELEILNLKKEIELKEKRSKDTIFKLNEELENLKDKLIEFNDIKSNYEKLSKKYRDLKEFGKEKTEMKIQSSIEDLKKNINLLTKEKEALKNQLEKLSQECIKEKEKNKNIEFEKKKLEFEVADLKNELSSKINMSFLERKNSNANEQSEIGFAIEGMLDEIKDNPRISLDDKKSLLIENNEIINKQREENDKLTNDIISLQNKFDKMQREKEKLEIQMQKNDLDKQKISLENDRIKNELKRNEEDNKALNEKIKDITSTKQNEIDKIKLELKDKVDFIEKILEEKKEYIKQYEKLQNEMEKNSSSEIIGEKSITPSRSELIISNSEVLGLKNEIQNLKLSNIQKDEEIRKLTALSKDRQLSDDEINTKLADLDFYKKSYEEQQARVNREHELISDSLYKLAVHFMGLKDDLQKKMKNK